jgi:undecaprenyl-phosphate 4-deoxy-4-formamido-L-arabinose transferase
MRLSVVVPVYNSESTIAKLVYTLLKVLDSYDCEIVLVNDASRDNSEAVCATLAERHYQVKFISLRKNRGEHNAVMCGLNHCTGDFVAIIDDDLQNPPSEIILLLNKAINGDYDVVYARYEIKQHSIFRNIGSWLTNRCATYLLEKDKDLYLSSFKIIRREIVEEIISYKGPSPYIDGLILRCTSNIGSELVLHESRDNGKSNYSFRKLVSLYLDMVVNYSNKTIRWIIIAGFLISLFSFALAGVVFYEKLFLHTMTSGWAVLAITFLFSVGLLFMVIGILGEYISNILMTINNTPQYTVKSRHNMDEAPQEYKNKEKEKEKEYDRKRLRVQGYGK